MREPPAQAFAIELQAVFGLAIRHIEHMHGARAPRGWVAQTQLGYGNHLPIGAPHTPRQALLAGAITKGSQNKTRSRMGVCAVII